MIMMVLMMVLMMMMMVVIHRVPNQSHVCECVCPRREILDQAAAMANSCFAVSRLLSFTRTPSFLRLAFFFCSQAVVQEPSLARKREKKEGRILWRSFGHQFHC
jgi:type IV secretory pathway VirB3-like protein